MKPLAKLECSHIMFKKYFRQVVIAATSAHT